MRALKVEQLIIAIEPSEHRLIQDILTLLEGTPARISILPDLYQMLLGSVKVNHLFGTPLIEIKQDLLPVWQAVLKRVIIKRCITTSHAFKFIIKVKNNLG